MNASSLLRTIALVGLVPLAVTGCGGDSSAGDAQTPPQGQAAMKAWLLEGNYKKWHCETAAHDARPPSPHGVNRICSNDLLSATAAGANYPAESAGVKELWDMVGGKVMGYAVYLKLANDSAAGANWYYYEDSPAINPMGGVFADGVGTSGNPKTVCVGCHMATGIDAMHSGHDFVYTQVK